MNRFGGRETRRVSWTSMRHPSRFSTAVLAAALLPAQLAASPPDTETPAELVDRTVAEAPNVEGQADALVRLIWFDDDRPVEAAAIARGKLSRFGPAGIVAMGKATRSIDPIYSADLTATMGEARLRISAGVPAGLLPAFDDALWYGSSDAQRLAMKQVAKYRFRASLLPVIDAAYEHPELKRIAAETLPLFRDARARFFLGDLLHTGDPDEKRAAADALANIGGAGIDTLRDGVLSENPATRMLSIEALLPHTGLDSLTTLHEYALLYPEDDPELLEKVRRRAQQLESLMEEHQDSHSATPEE